MAVIAHRPGRPLIEDDEVVDRSGAVATRVSEREAPADASAGEDVPGTVEPAADEAGTASAGGAARSDRRRLPRWLVPAAGALIVLALVGTAVVFAVQTVSGFGLEQDRGAALAAGRQAAVNLTTFDFTTAEADVQRMNESMTPTFARNFAGDKDGFVKGLRDDKIKMTGEATESGLADYNGRVAHVLVAVNATVGSADQPQTQPRKYRINLTMVYQDGSWLADRADFLS